MRKDRGGSQRAFSESGAILMNLVTEYERLGNFRILHIDTVGRIWASRGYTIYFSLDNGNSFRPRARFNAGRLSQFASRSSLAWRFIRGGFLSASSLSDSSLVASARGAILHCGPDETTLKPTLTVRGRTFRIESTPDDLLFTGEYFYNRDRVNVSIFCSEDKGKTWQKVYTFKRGEIRHVHAVRYDPYRKGLIVLTGDEDQESKILLTTDQFATLDILYEGDQSARAYEILPSSNGWYLSTDTQHEQNYIQFLSTSGSMERILPIAGSGLAGTRAGGHLFFGTAAEPSPVNLDPRPTLYGSSTGKNWEVVERWFADRYSRGKVWKSALFQMPRILLPSGVNTSSYLYATTVAVSSNDSVLHRWKIS